MFCPKCGNADQISETYCRKCGIFLPNFEKPAKKAITPQEHLTANTVLSLMTAVVSLTLAILLFSITLGKTDTHIIIFITGGFLFAMCAWQVQTFIRNLLLKKQLKQPQNIRLAQPDSIETNLRYEKSTQTNKLLDVADFSNIVPPSVVENTTKHLKEKIIN